MALDLWTLLRVSMDLLRGEVQRWAVLLCSFSLFVYAVAKPTPERIVAASLFTILVHLPIWFRRGAYGRSTQAARSHAEASHGHAEGRGEPG